MSKLRTSLLLSEWPDLDRRLWSDANTKSGFLEPDGRALHWTDKTRRGVEHRYGHWLGYLVTSKLLSSQQAPSSRINEESLAGYIHWLEDKGNASTTVTSCVRDLNEAVRVMEPEADLSIFTDLLATLHSRQSPVRNKHARIVHPGELLSGALAFLDAAPNQKFQNNFRRAVKYRAGLAIAFLACRPVRLANLTAITLGQHLIENNGRWHCSFEASEMKEKSPLSFSFPDVLVPYLKIYLNEYRPLLLKGNSSKHLWISQLGTPVNEHTMYNNICKLTETLFGQPLNPHLFRDCAASALATADPEHILAIARILGHATIKTANKHYNQSLMTAAGGILEDVINNLKMNGAP
jgi:integrase/recombinase XerD